MPTNTAWSRTTAEPAVQAARSALAATLPGGSELEAVVHAAAEHAELTAIAAGPSAAAAAAVAALVSEVLAELPGRLEKLPIPGDLVERVAVATGVDADALALAVAERTFAHPRVAALPPALALTTVMELLVILAPIGHASLWRRDCEAAVDCCIHAGPGCPTRSVRDAARRSLLSRGRRTHGLLQVVAVAGRDEAVVVARPSAGGRTRCLAFLRLATAALGPSLARLANVERDVPSGDLLAGASERRLARIGYDLHDGAVQSLAALLGDARLLQTQLASLCDGERMEQVSGRVGDLTARAVAAEFELRSLCQSLACPTIMGRPFDGVIEQEMITFQRLTGTRPRVELRGDFDELSDSQRLALIRIVQEALRNVREHASARNVAVVLRTRRRGSEAIVFDDGRGFDVDTALARAVRDGRIGLVGMMERVRLLGGSCEVRSRSGGPTTVGVMLPRWEAARAMGGPIAA